MSLEAWLGMMVAIVGPIGWALYSYTGEGDPKPRAKVYLDKPHDQPRRGGRHSPRRRR